MKQENKELLLQDLCARLPYGVKVKCEIYPFPVTVLYAGKYDEVKFKETGGIENICLVKPYLRPMSSMTKEELNECVCQSGIKDIECPNWQDIPKEKQFEARLNHAIAVFLTDSNNVDWLNAHHFDYRGLIPMGLALEAPEGIYNI